MSYTRNITQDVASDGQEDLLILEGDLSFVASDQVHQDDIVISNKGEWREHPLVGVGIMQFLNSDGTINSRISLQRKIRLQLEYDDFQVNEIRIDRDARIANVFIDAIRIK